MWILSSKPVAREAPGDKRAHQGLWTQWWREMLLHQLVWWKGHQHSRFSFLIFLQPPCWSPALTSHQDPRLHASSHCHRLHSSPTSLASVPVLLGYPPCSQNHLSQLLSTGMLPSDISWCHIIKDKISPLSKATHAKNTLSVCRLFRGSVGLAKKFIWVFSWEGIETWTNFLANPIFLF